jgi:hypothetical protein
VQKIYFYAEISELKNEMKVENRRETEQNIEILREWGIYFKNSAK